MEKISVAIRVRPPTKPECAKSFKWLVGQHSVTLYSLQGTPVSGQSFSFDHVFGTETKNVDIYGGLTKEVIMSTLNGFNGTVFAYGQTSSGKTYTMKGTPEDPGIIRLAVHDVFTRIQEICSREFLIRVSYMEIYNEEINDLFAPENRRLQIHENLEKGIFVAGLREEIVDSPEQVFQLLEFGESHRHFGETNMNLYSSRSHTIFRMVTESRGVTPDGKDADGNTDAVRVSALNLVDLAGSERIAKTGAGGVRLKEGTHINKSLMTLGTVINKLSDGGGRSGGHIPYRDSKLTRILQPALGGNARTAMICTVTPDEIHVDETRGTLQFASRAKRVTNCAQVNEILTDAALLKRQTREIEDLRMKLQGLPQSEQEILSLRNELLKNEVEKERLFLELQEEKKAQADRERRLKEQELKIENLSTLFMSSTVDDRQLRKVNRRETWCPRQLKSHQCAEDFSWKEATKPAQDGTADCLLYSMRRDRRVDLPPEFDTLVDEESWNDSSVLNDPLPPSDFENIADEDTWMSLNKGHTTSSTVFTSDMFERSRSSGGSSDAERLAAMEIDLTKLQEKYRDLETNFEAKLDESRKDLRAEVHRTKSQLEEVLLTNARLNTELENTLKANAILSRTLSAQLESQKLLRRVIDDVECEMDAARLLTSSLQGLLVDALHGQALTVQKIHGCFPLLKKSPYKSQDARERKVLMEMSTQKCRDICADVDGAVQDILANVKVRSEGNLDDFQCDAEDEQNEVKSKENSRDPASTGLTPQLSSEGDPLYCRVCLPSLLPSVTSHDSAKSLESKVCHMGTCQCDLIAETHSRLMTLVRRSECAVDHLFRIGDGTRTHGKNLVGVSSSAPSEAHLKKYEVTNSLAPDSIAVSHHTVLRSDESETGYTVESWNSGSGLRCDHLPEVQGRTSGSCAGHVNADTAENQIARAMGNLCGQILKLVTPTVESCKPTTTIRVQDDAGPQDVTLEARLTSAKVLTAWLFEELRGILNHDIDCLKSHVKERSSFGLMLESLQILLLENASLAVILVQATCQDNCVVEQLISKLEALKEVYISPSLEPQATKADVLLEKLDQTDRPLRIVQLAAPERQTFPAISRLEGPAETPSIPVPSRVMKLEGVEEMLGKLLQYFMGRLLNRENQVVNGITLLFAVTVVVRPMSTRPEESQGLEISVVRIEDEVNYCSQHDTMPTQTSAGVGDWIGIEVLKLICSESGSFAKSLDGDILNELCKAANVEEFLYRMSESYRQLRAQLAAEAERIKQLEYSLASSEMASVELKLELENLRVQICEVTSEQGVDYNFELELEALKIRCENYEEEIRLIMEQVPTPDDDLRRDRLLADVRNENLYLRNCLVKANKRLAENRRRRSSKAESSHSTETTRKVADAAVSCEGVGISCPVGPGVQDSVVNPEKHAEASVRDKEYIANTEDFVPSRLQVNSPRSGDDGRSDFDAYGCSDKRKPSYSVVKSGRLALGELELNRNNVAVPKRSRQQRASDYVLNKENLAVFR